MGTEIGLKHNIVVITVRGRWTPEDALAAQQTSAELVRTHGIRGVLVDLREADFAGAGTLDIFKLTASHVDVFPQGTIHAVVVRSAPQMQEDARFAENVGVNRGVRLRTFRTVEDAEVWLRGEIGD